MGLDGPITVVPPPNDANWFESGISFLRFIWNFLVNSVEELIMFFQLIFKGFSAFEYLARYLPNILAIGFFCFFAISVLKIFMKRGH